MFNAEMKT